MSAKRLENRHYYLVLAWTIALIALLGSLFFSGVMKLIPCTLCWYQRIFMFPLVITLAIGILRHDDGVIWYAWPLILLGSTFALYHSLLSYGVIHEGLLPCGQDISCTNEQGVLLGFLSIPLLSLVAFLLMGGLLCAFNLSRKSD